MEKLRKLVDSELHPKSRSCYLSLGKLIAALEERELPERNASEVSALISALNQKDLSHRRGRKEINSTKDRIIKMVEKQLKIVPKNYYRNLWMVLGMSAMGMPLGVAFGVSLGNMAFIGIGIPIGMSIGMAIGAGMDEKAKKEGRQLPFESNL